MINFSKIAAKREKRKEDSEEIEGQATLAPSADYAATCPDHPGVRRLRMGDADKKAAKINPEQVAWKCPEDGKVYASEGSTADQTKVMSQFNNYHRNSENMNEDDGEEAAKKLTKEFTYETRDLA
jgi:hypothetical protein